MHFIGLFVVLFGLGLVVIDCRGRDQLAAAFIIIALVGVIVHAGTR